MKANIKNLSFLIASYSEMIKTFGYSKKTTDFFETQMQNLRAISQIKSSDIFYVNRVIGANKIEIKEQEVIARINSFNTTMTHLLSIEKLTTEHWTPEFYKMYYSGQYNKDILRIVGDIFEINIKDKTKKINPSIKFGSFSMSNEDGLEDFNKLKQFINENITQNIYSSRIIKVTSENPNYTGCSGSSISLYDCFDYSDLKSQTEIKKLIRKIAGGGKAEVYNVESNGCHSHEYIDIALTKKFNNLNIDYNKLYNELEEFDIDYSRD